MALLTVKQVAEQLNVSDALIYALAESEKLVGYKIGVGRGTWRFHESDVLDFLQASKSAHRQPAPRPRAKRPQPFRHLDGERLRAAWQRQGVPVDPPNADSALSSESSCAPSIRPRS